jgi:hypothetical protein
LNSEDSVQIFDFDGTNLHKLSSSLGAYTPFFDRDYEALFTIASNPNEPTKTTLFRTELKVLPQGQ